MENKKEKRPVGAPPKMKDGRKMHVYLDAATIELAGRVGGGNVSEGLRQLRIFYEAHKDESSIV